MLTTLLLAFLIGSVAGLRAMSPPAVVSWAVHLGWLGAGETWLDFLGTGWVRWTLTALALAELITDKLPATPSRKTAAPFATRLVSGAFCGAAIGLAGGMMIAGGLAGALGAAFGTWGGYAVRARLAATFRQDLPAALLEDTVAVVAAVLICLALR